MKDEILCAIYTMLRFAMYGTRLGYFTRFQSIFTMIHNTPHRSFSPSDAYRCAIAYYGRDHIEIITRCFVVGEDRWIYHGQHIHEAVRCIPKLFAAQVAVTRYQAGHSKLKTQYFAELRAAINGENEN